MNAEVPGLPLIGNLLQLKEKKPYKTFTKWAEEYGPVYSIRTGYNSIVVLNSNDVAKEVIKLLAIISMKWGKEILEILGTNRKN